MNSRSTGYFRSIPIEKIKTAGPQRKVIIAIFRTASGVCYAAPGTIPPQSTSKPVIKSPSDIAAFMKKLKTAA